MASRDNNDNKQHDDNDNHDNTPVNNADDMADNNLNVADAAEIDHQECVTLTENDMYNKKAHGTTKKCETKHSPQKIKYADDMLNDVNEENKMSRSMEHAERDTISNIAPEISKYGNDFYHSKGVPLQKWPRPASNHGNLFGGNTNVNVNLKKEKSITTQDLGIVPSEKYPGVGAIPRFHKERIYNDVLKEISPYLIKHGLHGMFSRQLDTSLVVMSVEMRRRRRNSNVFEEGNVVMEGHHQASISHQPPPELSQPVQDHSDHQTTDQVDLNQDHSGEHSNHESTDVTSQAALGSLYGTGNHSRHGEYPGEPEIWQDQTGTASAEGMECVVPPRPKVYYLLAKGMPDSSTQHLSAATSLISQSTHLHSTRRWRRSSQIPSLPDQYQLVVQVTEKSMQIAAMPRSANITSSTYRRDLTSYVQQWRHYLTREGARAEMQATSNVPVVVTYGSTSVVLQELASQGFSIAGEVTDVDPVMLLAMHQREEFNESIQPLQESDQTAPPTLFSQLGPGSYDHSRTGAIFEFNPLQESSYAYSSLVQNTWDEASNPYMVNYEASQATNNDRHQSPTSPVSKYSQGFVSPPAATVEGNEAFVYHHHKSQHGHRRALSYQHQSLSELLEQIPIEETARVQQQTVLVQEETANTLSPQILPPDSIREPKMVYSFFTIEDTHHIRILTSSDGVHDNYQITCKPIQESKPTGDDITDTDHSTGFISTSASKMDTSGKFL